MDGNGRWAQGRGLPRTDGYAEGLTALRKTLARAAERGVQAVTVYAFSTENFARPDDETTAIVSVVRTFNRRYDGDMKVTYMGDVYAFGEDFADSVEDIEKRTGRKTANSTEYTATYFAVSIHASEMKKAG